MLVKKSIDDHEYLKDAPFEEIANSVKTFYSRPAVIKDDLIRTGISIPLNTLQRAEIIADKTDMGMFKTYMAMTIFGYFRFVDEYEESLENIDVLRKKLVYIDDEDLSRDFYSHRTHIDVIKSGVLSKVSIDRFYYDRLRNVGVILGTRTTDVLRITWYKTLKNLEEGLLSDLPKGKYDVLLKEIDSSIKFRGRHAKDCIKGMEG